MGFPVIQVPEDLIKSLVKAILGKVKDNNSEILNLLLLF